MAIKKSELYSSLWASCDELRGSMDASQYKDYVLVMLFMKYVSDKKDPLVEISEGLYTIQQGDTLYSLSKKFNLSVDDLKKLNDISDNAINIGQKIKIK